MPILSIQSHVAYGHVGNAAAVFPIQRLGIEAWPVHTVQLSNHTGYPDWGGGALAAAEVADVLAGLERRGAFAAADALLSGYVGGVELAAVVAGAADRLKAANPRALYCCDPVIGNDEKGLFVPPDVARAMAETLLPRADIATPNRFELAYLSGSAAASIGEIRAAADALAARGPGIVVVTSVALGAKVGVLARDGTGAWLVETPRLAVAANGAGDAFCAMLLARLVRGEALAAALADAVSSIFGILSRSDGGELPLVAAQDEIVAPTRRFAAVAIP